MLVSASVYGLALERSDHVPEVHIQNKSAGYALTKCATRRERAGHAHMRETVWMNNAGERQRVRVRVGEW